MAGQRDQSPCQVSSEYTKASQRVVRSLTCISESHLKSAWIVTATPCPFPLLDWVITTVEVKSNDHIFIDSGEFLEDEHFHWASCYQWQANKSEVLVKF